MTEDEQQRKLEQYEREAQECIDKLIALFTKINDGLEGLNGGIKT